MLIVTLLGYITAGVIAAVYDVRRFNREFAELDAQYGRMDNNTYNA